jgi:hypothetical protein
VKLDFRKSPFGNLALKWLTQLSQLTVALGFAHFSMRIFFKKTIQFFFTTTFLIKLAMSPKYYLSFLTCHVFIFEFQTKIFLWYGIPKVLTDIKFIEN